MLIKEKIFEKKHQIPNQENENIIAYFWRAILVLRNPRISIDAN